MKPGLAQSTVRVFEPSELAPSERERLLGALEGFVNLGDSLKEFLNFGRQNPEFFPLQILDYATVCEKPLAPPFVQGTSRTEAGERKIWTKVIAWEPCSDKLALFYRDVLRGVWPPSLMIEESKGDSFLLLLAILSPTWFGDWQTAFGVIRQTYPRADSMALDFPPLLADWKTGAFGYRPDNDFQRAVYILFREGWRAKTCVQCKRRFIADKPLRFYCSTKCTGEAKRERNLAWWNKHGKKWRARRMGSSRHKSKKLRGKGGK